MKKIAINELKATLNYKDLRAVRKWCIENDVLIIKHGKNEFVFETAFIEVFERPFINKLKRKFGKIWESAYRLYKDGNIPALNMLQETPLVVGKSYKPKNTIVNDYLNKYKSHKKAA